MTYTPIQKLFNIDRSMGQGTLGGTVRAAQPFIRTTPVTGAPRPTPSTAAGTPTFFLAAADATDFEKSIANDVAGGIDDTVLIQSYLDSVGDGSRLVLSSGTFITTTHLLMNDNQTLQGMGFGTVIQADPGWSSGITGAGIILFTSSATFPEGLIIRDLVVDANNVAATGITGFYTYNTPSTIEHVWAKRADIGFAGMTGVTLSRCFADNCIWGFEFFIDCQAFDCIATSCTEIGFSVSNSRVVGCIADSCGIAGGGTLSDPFYAGFNFVGISQASGIEARSCYHGISVSDGGDGSVLEGFTVWNSSGNGVLIQGSSQNVLSSGYIENATNHGIMVISTGDPASYNSILKCGFDGNGDTTHDDVFINKAGSGAVVDNIINTNKFWNSSARYHVNLSDSGITNTWVAMNDMYLNGVTGRINNVGTGTITAPGNRGIDF